MVPIKLNIDSVSAPLVIKYNFVFEYNGLKYDLPEDFDDKIKINQTVEIRLVSLPQSCNLLFDESDFLDLLTALKKYDMDC